MKAWLTLAEAAQVEGGKLYILGGGIYIIGPGPVNMGIALQVVAPWEMRSRRMHARVVLNDERNQPLPIPGPVGSAPLEVHADLEVAPSRGTPAGSDLPFSFAFMASGLLLPPGDYAWAAFIDDDSNPIARAPFTVRAPFQPPQANPSKS